ncbi:MAG: gamma-glutamyltransferase [Candidatus Zixiibacteriota bacterium]
MLCHIHRRLLCTLAAVSLLLAGLYGCTGIRKTRFYRLGALATASPIATEIGVQVLERGGNAFDAAVAVGFVLAVVHPEAGNIGGGGFALIRHGRTGEVRALDFRETAPLRATADMYLDRQGNVIPDASIHGALACGVPGTVAGLHALWEKYGVLRWDSLVGPAADLANKGFEVDEYLAQSLDKHRDGLSSFEETRRVYFPNDETLREGDTLVQKDLAATLYAIAVDGPKAFYRGPIARQIVDCMDRHGGWITLEDLAAYTPVWRDPVRFSLNDSLIVYSMPPPSSGGIAVGQILKLLTEIQKVDFRQLTPQTPGYIHLFCEAARLAFADRSRHLGDPGFYPIPDSVLLDSAYLSRRWKQVKTDQATPSEQITPGEILVTESPQTTHFSVCDSAGNMVAITYTLNTSYGSKLMVDGAGFLLNNEMDDFSISPGHPNVYVHIGGEANKIAPGKRMLSSMAPTIVLKKGGMKHLNISPDGSHDRPDIDGQPFLILGAPGGSRIITVVAQAIINFTQFNLSLNETVAQPRFHHQWLPDRIMLEAGEFDSSIVDELGAFGHAVQKTQPYSDLQMVYIRDAGLMAAASDPRRNGAAAGCDYIDKSASGWLRHVSATGR